MAAYVAGDKAAFDELFKRYAPVLLRVMRQQLRSQEEANDLVQQTFLQLHRARHDFRVDAKLRPWIFTIALNLKREHLRRIKRRPEAELVLDGKGDPNVKPDVARLEAARTLHFALERLQPTYREVIELHWLGQLSFPEISELLGDSLSAVKVRAHRGYSALREILEEGGE